jgi:hypothetical protein
MTQKFQIQADWEDLPEGSPEERSCFAALGIQINGIWLTEGHDALVNRLREKPFLSAYHLAEWFAWNWWRLRWEPRATNPSWKFAHQMASIGGGYIWPNLTIFSDGKTTTLDARSSREQEISPFRYIAESTTIISSLDFESEIDRFVNQVIERLDSRDLENSNLNNLWQELSTERSNAKYSRIRKIEALLGLQPDELSDDVGSNIFSIEEQFGEEAADELVADQGSIGSDEVISADELASDAKHAGYETDITSIVDIKTRTSQGLHTQAAPAWLVGAELAKDLRKQEGLKNKILSNKSLSDLISVDSAALPGKKISPHNISYLLSQKGGKGKVILRSKWETGRRFELARILGDCLISNNGVLHPATRALTYRQKVQRAFAAELLSPYAAIQDMLDGDFSQESQAEVANHFKVSEMTIRHQLANNSTLAREYIDSDFDHWRILR